jgi:hypothetical protein
MIKYIKPIFLSFLLLLPAVAVSQEAGDTSSSGAAADAAAQKSPQQSTPSATSTSAPNTPSSPAPEKPDSSGSAPKEDSASSAASEALKASKEEEEKSKSQEVASEAVEKGGLISGKFQISFTENYTHLQTNQLYIEGFGILPIVVVGNVDIQNVRRDIFTSVLGASYRLTDKLQVSLNVPWQYSMASISTATGINGRKAAAANNEGTSRSSSLGDITTGMFYQLKRESLSLPSLSGSLDLKLRNGRDFFETPDPAAHAPVGTGFYMLRASLSASKTSAPAVVYGALGYAYNFARHNIPYAPAGASGVLIKSYEPGPSFNVSAGVSLSLNYQLSLNWSVAEASQLASKVNGSVSPNSATNAISFRMGGIYRVSSKTSVDLSLTTGLTNDAGGTTIALRLPWSY